MYHFCGDIFRGVPYCENTNRDRDITVVHYCCDFCVNLCDLCENTNRDCGITVVHYCCDFCVNLCDLCAISRVDISL